jgi:hypothetical protein
VLLGFDSDADTPESTGEGASDSPGGKDPGHTESPDTWDDESQRSHPVAPIGAPMRSPAPYREIDDIGLLPITTDTAEVLYRVVDAAYEKRSNRSLVEPAPAGFDKLMPKTIANATVDRLMHHAHHVVTDGDLIGLTQAIHGKGVTALST